MRIRLIGAYALFLLALATVAAVVAMTVPARLFTQANTTFVFSFLSALVVAGITGGASYVINRYIERPLLRIEHIDIKSEREPFILPEDLWWQITHVGFPKYVDDRVRWPVTCFDKNEFQYFHLQDLQELLDQRILKYQTTANWTRSVLERLGEFKKTKTLLQRKAIIEDLSPDIIKFDDHYRETKKSSLLTDLLTKPDEAADFMTAETEGMLLMHERELNTFIRFKDWIATNLKKGENKPRAIDHLKKRVPTITIVAGTANLGRTPALVKLECAVIFKNREMPIRLDTKRYDLYAKIDPNQVLPLIFEINTSKCGFDLNSDLYTALTTQNSSVHFELRLVLADNSVVSRKKVPLIDNSNLPV